MKTGDFLWEICWYVGVIDTDFVVHTSMLSIIYPVLPRRKIPVMSYISLCCDDYHHVSMLLYILACCCREFGENNVHICSLS